MGCWAEQTEEEDTGGEKASKRARTEDGAAAEAPAQEAMPAVRTPRDEPAAPAGGAALDAEAPMPPPRCASALQCSDSLCARLAYTP